MCLGTQNRKTDLNSLSLLRNKAWQACSTSEKQQLVKPTGKKKRTHFIFRRKTLLVNHHRRALRAGHSSTWRHFLQLTPRSAGCCQPAAQSNPKLKETNNPVPWAVPLNSPPQAFGRWGKRLFLHHSPSHSCAFRNRALQAILSPQECMQGAVEAAAAGGMCQGTLLSWTSSAHKAHSG